MWIKRCQLPLSLFRSLERWSSCRLLLICSSHVLLGLPWFLLPSTIMHSILLTRASLVFFCTCWNHLNLFWTMYTLLSTWSKSKRYSVWSNSKLYIKWSTLNQGGRSVSEYIREWEKLTVLCEINDTEDLKLAKFMAGLRENIREKLMVIPNLDLQLAFNMAISIEQAYTKKKMSKNNYFKSPRSFTPRNNNPRSPRLQKKTEQPPSASGKAVVPMRKTVCFKCHGHWHYKDSCPNARVFTKYLPKANKNYILIITWQMYIVCILDKLRIGILFPNILFFFF